jgi:hypothetical protein
MAWKFDDIAVGKRIFCGVGLPVSLGIGPAEIRGSAYIESPMIVGSPLPFPNVQASLMVGPMFNSDSPPPIIPGVIVACGVFNHSPYSLCVNGDAAIFNDLDVNQGIAAGGNINAGRNIVAQGEVMSLCGGHRLSLKKNFDIPHPSKEGWRLRHTCLEGPSNDIFIRGRVRNKTEIDLPEYWKDFVDITSITVSLTPIGAHQEVIVKRIDKDKIHLQSKGGMPIDCFYHVFAERIDGEKLIPEYPGSSPADYPGNNDEYSISGYHYDRKSKEE